MKLKFKYLRVVFLVFGFAFHVQMNADLQKKDTRHDALLVEFNNVGLSSIQSKADDYNANIIKAGSVWGQVNVKYRVKDGAWLDIYRDQPVVEYPSSNTVSYSNIAVGTALNLIRTFERSEDKLTCTFRIKNCSDFPIEIGDLSFPFPISTPNSFGNKDDIFEKGFIKHQFIGNDGSYVFYTRAGGQPPYLVTTPIEGTSFEYFHSDQIFVHSKMSASAIEDGTWRLDNTGIKLNPDGADNDFVEYGYTIQWANSYDEIRELLYENNLFDVRFAPGMVLPVNLTGRFSLRTKNDIDSIVTEYPQQTELRLTGKTDDNHYLYEVAFNKLGENILTVYYNSDKNTVLEFFCTEPIDTLIRKRADFLVESQQHKDPSKWYNGLYSIWDMRNKTLRGPDDTDGFDHWWGYVLAADDPGLCKAPFLAAKNVYLPVEKEIKSIEYYIENYVWGGLQRTDSETPYPYGVYGVPNWKVNRDGIESRAKIRNYNLEKTPVWRAYDYPHIFMLYYHMFQIAEYYPEYVNFRDAKGYLNLAYQTAKAYFTYPYEILPYYEIYQWGFYNELVLMPMLDDLKRYDMNSEADFIRDEWEKKVKYFVYDDKYPYRSEYPFDRTAFESSYALAKYGVLNDMKPDKDLWYDVKLEKWYSHPDVKQEDSEDFMERQHLAGLAVRGWIEPAYYHYGSDLTMSYMARMGGWSILDYALSFSSDPWDWLQLGYASYLSSYALLNTGTADSDYGYWYPGKENDGAAGWSFNTNKYSPIWLQSRLSPRGAWQYDGEIDLGNGAIFRMSSTILANDPLFGWLAYGGKLNILSDKDFSIIPCDGVRNRFWVVDKDFRIGLELSRDGFMYDKPIVSSKDGDRIEFILENRGDNNHKTPLTIKTDGVFRVFVDNIEVEVKETVRMSDNVKVALLPVTNSSHKVIVSK